MEISVVIQLFTILLVGLIPLFAVIVILYLLLLMIGGALKSFWHGISRLLRVPSL